MTNFKILIFWLARIYIIYESFINLIGVLWFNTSLETGVTVAGLFSAAAGFIVTLMPRNFMSDSKSLQLAIFLLCFIAIGSQIFLIVGDLSLAGELNTNNIFKRVMFVVALVVVVAETILLKKNNNKMK